jgi:23S rRNA pseudouridine2605 synthase
MRINSFLAKAGLGSRRKVEQLVLSGRVTLNNKIIKKLSTQICPTDVVKLDGKRLKNYSEPSYYVLNKPVGYVSTNYDPHAGKTVMDLFRKKTGLGEGFFIVGRLDKNSRGLIIITNDGDFAQKVSHPKGGCEKEYRVRVKLPKKNATACVEKTIRYFKCGTLLDKKKTLPAQIKMVGVEKGEAIFEIVLKEGRKRQIRRIFEKAGMEVVDLLRVRIGPIGLEDLYEGEFRNITYTMQKFINISDSKE